MQKKTLVIGASLKLNRHSNIAINRLVSSGLEVVAYGLRKGEVSGINIDTELKHYKGIDTITLYLHHQRQQDYYKYIVSLNPKRVVFNPGSENPELFQILKDNNIEFEVACTLTLLTTNQY